MKKSLLPRAGALAKAGAVILALTATLASRPAQAALTIIAEETGGNVVFSWAAGQTLDLSALNAQGVTSPYLSDVGAVNPSRGGGSAFASDVTGSSEARFINPLAISNAFGLPGTTSGGIPTGDPLRIVTVPIGPPFGTRLGFPDNAVAAPGQDAGSGTLTFLGTDFATLGITPTNITLASWGSGSNADSILLTFTAPVPEPSRALLLLLGLLPLAMRRRR